MAHLLTAPIALAALQEFSQLDLTEQTQRAVSEMGFVHMTEVQARTIPQLLVGRDVLGAAKTGTCGGRPLLAGVYVLSRVGSLAGGGTPPTHPPTYNYLAAVRLAWMGHGGMEA